jgi:predicted PurR-regulated permease PerM
VQEDGRTASRLVRAGRVAWAGVGLILLLVLFGAAVSRISLVVIATLVALFPGALLEPAARWLRSHHVPAALAALLVLLLPLAALAATAVLLAPRVSEQLPDLRAAVVDGIDTVDDWLAGTTLPVALEDVEQLFDEATSSLEASDVANRGLDAVLMVADVVTGVLLGLVVLFFVLRDGRRLWTGVLDLLPPHRRDTFDDVAGQVWWTLGAYLRGQLLVAAFDAVFIGLGLLLLDVPLALPLAVLVLLGGLFPIVGAFVSGLVAVLVALAAEGLMTALLVLALIVVVQQVEGNVLEPLILSKVIALHPLVVILSISAGAVWLGVLGAFLAVPVAASIARVVDHLRGRTPDAGPASRSSSEDEPDEQDEPDDVGEENGQETHAATGPTGSTRVREQGRGR